MKSVTARSSDLEITRPITNLKYTSLGSITITHYITLTPNFLRTKQNLCRHGPCKNNGTCQAGFTSRGFRCVCPIGILGKKCERGKQQQQQQNFIN